MTSPTESLFPSPLSAEDRDRLIALIAEFEDYIAHADRWSHVRLEDFKGRFREFGIGRYSAAADDLIAQGRARLAAARTVYIGDARETMLGLLRLPPELLAPLLADVAIASAYMLNETPHEVLRLAIDKMGWGEDRWPQVKANIDALALGVRMIEAPRGE